MPAFIVKAYRDEDFYVRWSTIVDSPTNWGPRGSFNEPDERFARADINGTSAAWPDLPEWDQPFGWNDHEFIVMEGAPDPPEDHYWTLPRENLKPFCVRLDRGEDPSDLMTAVKHD